MLSVTVSISNTTKHCNETPSSRNTQNETIYPSICKTEFFCSCGNNHLVATIISSDCVLISLPSHFFKVLMLVCGNILYLWVLLVFIKRLRLLQICVQELWMCIKNIIFFVLVHTRAQWVKPAWLTEPMSLTPAFLTEPCERRRLVYTL